MCIINHYNWTPKSLFQIIELNNLNQIKQQPEENKVSFWNHEFLQQSYLSTYYTIALWNDLYIFASKLATRTGQGERAERGWRENGKLQSSTKGDETVRARLRQAEDVRSTPRDAGPRDSRSIV